MNCPSAGCARHEARRSPMAISQLSALGWKVVPKVGARLETYPQLAGQN